MVQQRLAAFIAFLFLAVCQTRAAGDAAPPDMLPDSTPGPLSPPDWPSPPPRAPNEGAPPEDQMSTSPPESPLGSSPNAPSMRRPAAPPVGPQPTQGPESTVPPSDKRKTSPPPPPRKDLRRPPPPPEGDTAPPPMDEQPPNPPFLPSPPSPPAEPPAPPRQPGDAQEPGAAPPPWEQEPSNPPFLPSPPSPPAEPPAPASPPYLGPPPNDFDYSPPGEAPTQPPTRPARPPALPEGAPPPSDEFAPPADLADVSPPTELSPDRPADAPLRPPAGHHLRSPPSPPSSPPPPSPPPRTPLAEPLTLRLQAGAAGDAASGVLQARDPDSGVWGALCVPVGSFGGRPYPAYRQAARLACQGLGLPAGGAYLAPPQQVTDMDQQYLRMKALLIARGPRAGSSGASGDLLCPNADAVTRLEQCPGLAVAPQPAATCMHLAKSMHLAGDYVAAGVVCRDAWPPAAPPPSPPDVSRPAGNFSFRVVDPLTGLPAAPGADGGPVSGRLEVRWPVWPRGEEEVWGSLCSAAGIDVAVAQYACKSNGLPFRTARFTLPFGRDQTVSTPPMALVIVEDCRLTAGDSADSSNIDGSAATGLSCGRTYGPDELRFQLWRWRVQGEGPEGMSAALAAGWRSALRQCVRSDGRPARQHEAYVICEGSEPPPSSPPPVEMPTAPPPIHGPTPPYGGYGYNSPPPPYGGYGYNSPPPPYGGYGGLPPAYGAAPPPLYGGYSQ